MYRSRGEPETAETDVGHEALVAALAAFLRPALYVELGCAGGATFRLVAPHAGTAIAVDIEPHAHLFAGISNGRFVRRDTVEFLRAMGDDCIDMCFLDSSHQEDATIAEFAELARTMRPNGVVLMHDSYPPSEAWTSAGSCGRVCAAIPRLKARFAGSFEFATLPGQYGLTIARKNLGRQLLWRADA